MAAGIRSGYYDLSQIAYAIEISARKQQEVIDVLIATRIEPMVKAASAFGDMVHLLAGRAQMRKGKLVNETTDDQGDKTLKYAIDKDEVESINKLAQETIHHSRGFGRQDANIAKLTKINDEIQAAAGNLFEGKDKGESLTASLKANINVPLLVQSFGESIKEAGRPRGSIDPNIDSIAGGFADYANADMGNALPDLAEAFINDLRARRNDLIGDEKTWLGVIDKWDSEKEDIVKKLIRHARDKGYLDSRPKGRKKGN